jgi:VWFA-related protein
MRFLLLLSVACACAQESVIRTTVPLVLVPTTVTDRHGKTVDGLNEADFEVLDNGKPVKHSLEVTSQPIALVVAVQTSAIAGPALAKIQKIGSMFEPLVVGDRGSAAILTYSDKITLWQDFTRDADEFTARMRRIEPDGSAAKTARMNDAVIEAVNLLETRPSYRRVLVVIGESRDRGSQATLEDAVTRAQAANVTVYPMNYSVYATSFTSRGAETFKNSGKAVYPVGTGIDLLAVFTEIARMGAQNGGDALAKYTGGAKVSFTKLAGLERVTAKVGEDLHSQYLLSFQAADNGESRTYHELTVRVKRSDVTARTRPGYWAQ